MHPPAQPPNCRQMVFWSVVLTVLFEGVTALLRFGFDLESSRESASTIGVLTGNVRIHHGYIGLLIVLIGVALARRYQTLGRWLGIVGIALVASDLIHHFLVLWPIVGSPQFDLVYPRNG